MQLYLCMQALTPVICSELWWPVGIILQISHNMKLHISPVQISRFSHANLTFLQCKSHISPVQISNLIWCIDVYQVHTADSGIVCEDDLEKCEICTGEMWDLHMQEKCEICTGEMWDLEWRNFIWSENDPNRPPCIVSNKWPELVLAETMSLQ